MVDWGTMMVDRVSGPSHGIQRLLQDRVGVQFLGSRWVVHLLLRVWGTGPSLRADQIFYTRVLYIWARLDSSDLILLLDDSLPSSSLCYQSFKYDFVRLSN